VQDIRRRGEVDIRPIRTEQDYDMALAEIDRLWGSEAGSAGRDKLSVLMTLVAAYEDKHYPPSPPDPIEAIEYYMDKLGLTRKDLEPHMGGRSHVSEILNRIRPLSLAMIRALERQFGIPAEVLIREYALEGGEVEAEVEAEVEEEVATSDFHRITVFVYQVPVCKTIVPQGSPARQDTLVAPVESWQYDRAYLDSPVLARCH
jgi:HTH-type transcriptional regulator/antitoxin HigA